jgi:UDP-N-acetyl-D-mannosaminuronate dehydrogenase
VIKRNKVVVVGLGEVGKPLFELVSKHYDAVGVDISPVSGIQDVDVLHVCYPFQIKNFIPETARYIRLFKPALTVINSTVAVGTTRKIADLTSRAVVNSPVRGKHSRMFEELCSYRKFIGAMDQAAAEHAVRHFKSMGLKTTVLSSPEATELAKLTETTYFGVMIAWAQEIERYCDESGQSYDEVISFYDEIKFFPPVKYFPGVIGGHCVMPNIKILSSFSSPVMLKAIEKSNALKVAREAKSKKVKANRSSKYNGTKVAAVA